MNSTQNQTSGFLTTLRDRLLVNGILIIFALAVAILLAACDNPEKPGDPVPPIPPPVPCKPIIKSVQAQPSIVSFGAKVQLAAIIENSCNQALTYRWTCNAGSFIGGTSADKATWQAPATGGVYRCDVTVSNGQDSVISGIDINVNGCFFEDFSGDLSAWINSYCTSWITAGEGHVKGSSSGYYGSIYHEFGTYVSPEYTIKMKAAKVGSFISDDALGPIIGVADIGSTRMTAFWFKIFPSTSGKNWALKVFIIDPYESDWYLVDDDSYGWSPLIKTGANEYNDISWTIDKNKKMTIWVNGQLFYETNAITEMEDYFSESIDMDMRMVGCRTEYMSEAKFDDVQVISSGNIVKPKSNGLQSISSYNHPGKESLKKQRNKELMQTYISVVKNGINK